MVLVHGSCVSIDGAGVLICGRSGGGKSDLALRLIDGGGLLVADDQVEITRSGATLVAAAPPVLRGRLEVRGIGIVELPYAESAVLKLAVDLRPRAEIERLPKPQSSIHEGMALPRVDIDPRDASAAARLKIALRGAVAG